jgi:hypothetical protein
MSNPDQQNRAEQLCNSLKELDALELVSKKSPAIKELEKVLKQMASVDVTKGTERAKLGKTLEKVNDAILLVSTIDRLLKEKDF